MPDVVGHTSNEDIWLGASEGIRFATSVAPVRLPAWEPYSFILVVVFAGLNVISLSEEINNFVSEIVLVSARVF